MKSNQFDELQQWLETQTIHWQSLLTDKETAPGDWQTLLNRCRSLAQQQSDDQSELTESMVQQAKGFSRYGERLLRYSNLGYPRVDLAAFLFYTAALIAAKISTNCNSSNSSRH